eukprot:TRINITY_DN15755_c0_g1_i1.p1 TRINITY_DN15755_c0_g1~~TRINITY_DN15755_c0_g1_i1.p1  ORF type:complete len:111 (-),score=40.38 TRINITY_DN15755_c0_g1_i1:143-439(-)
MLQSDRELRTIHKSTAQSEQCQTKAPDPEADINLHFVSFVVVNDQLYELDGCKPCPISHGRATKPTLLKDAAKVIGEMMLRDGQELRFSMLALVKKST